MSSVNSAGSTLKTRYLPDHQRTRFPAAPEVRFAGASATVNAADQADLKGKPDPTTTKHRFFGDRSRLALGFFLEDVLPPLLGFAFLTGPIGWVITLGSLPLSYLSGKLGRRIAKDVKAENLSGGMKSFHEFREGFRNRHELQGTQLMDKWNRFIDDALNVNAGKYQAFAGMFAKFLRVNQSSKLGQILCSKQFLKANINHNVAQANSVGGAIKAGAKGGIGYWFDTVVTPGIGTAMEKSADCMWGPFKWPFKAGGWLLKNWQLLRLGRDVISTPTPKS